MLSQWSAHSARVCSLRAGLLTPRPDDLRGPGATLARHVLQSVLLPRWLSRHREGQRRTQPVFVPRECSVKHSHPGTVKREGVEIAFADVEPDEHIDRVDSIDAADSSVFPLAHNYFRHGASRKPRHERPRARKGPAPLSESRPPTRHRNNAPVQHGQGAANPCRVR